jgi:hypothetical protein
MKFWKLLFLATSLLLTETRLAAGAQTTAIDFDGLSSSMDLLLTNQVPGLYFDGVQVVTPATIGNSPGIPMSAATSGSSAAFSSGAKIYFSNSVVKVEVTVSPSFITVPLVMQAAWETAYLIAYKADGTVLTRSQTQIIGAVGKDEDVTNFTPSVLSVSSTTPIAYITLDLDDPFNYSGNTFFFDALILTIAAPAVATRPTIQVAPGLYGTVDLGWGFSNCDLQWTTNLATGQWQSFEATNFRVYTAVPSTSPMMYFRVKRLLPPQ